MNLKKSSYRQQKLESYFLKAKPHKKEAVPLFPDISTISCERLVNMITSNSEFLLVDARYDYEFQGGHIKNAVNAATPENLIPVLKAGVPIIIYCEYSIKRGPTLLRFLRNYDRKINAENYPMLTFPELYLLEGGYSAFFKSFEEFCEPRNYIQEKHPAFKGIRSKRQKHSRRRFI